MFFGIYQNGVIAQDGLIKSYYPNNHLESAVYYAKDVINVTARWFYPSGVLKEEKNYLMGKLNGFGELFREMGYSVFL